jgi:hypothetical protein
MTFPNFVYTADTVPAAPAKVDNPSSSWKETKLILDTHSYSWCGDRHIVFGGDNFGKSGKGIRIYDLGSGVIEDITNDPKHKNISCTADGRYVVFTDDFIMNKKGSLFVYDRNTKIIKKMYEMDLFLLRHIDSMPLSPSANYLLGPDLSGVQKYILPGGKEVKLLPYKTGVNHIPEFDIYQWSANEKRIFLFDRKGGRLTIRDLEKNTDKNLSFRVNNFWLRNVRITKDNKLYVDAMSGSDMGDGSITNLYLFNLANPDKHELLASGIQYYDTDDNGNVVFSKKLKDRHVIYYLARGGKQKRILKEIIVPRNIGICPSITNDGKGIIFSIPTSPRGRREVTILIRN